ncbi:MAG TPA: DUF58 domain-containing protein, partial [Gemmatimonadaceae bacterium]|nr:DUF58 domain-containing protein [Gemmatimonadaceae bacterium]
MSLRGWWAEQRRDLRFLPTRRLAAAVAVASPLWLFDFFEGGRVAGMFAVAILVVATIVDALTLPSRRDVAVDRELPPTIGVGDVVNGEIRVATRWRAPLAVRVFDQLPAALEQVVGHDPHTRTVPRGGTLAFPFQVRGRTRGRWALGPVVVRAVGPLGFVQRSLEYPHRTAVDEETLSGQALGDWAIVAPSIAGIRHFRLLALQQRLREAGPRSLRRRGEGLSFAGLREYVVGDDPRRIDWKATARRQKPIAREYTIEQGQTVMIAIDAGRLMTQLAGDLSRFE